MVYQQTQPGEVAPKRKHSKFLEILFDLLVMVVVAGATYALFRFTIVRPENQEQNNPEVVNKVPADGENSMWLQQTINLWLSSFPEDARVGVLVHDLDNNSVLGEVNADESFAEQTESELGLKVNRHFTNEGQTTAKEMADIAKMTYVHEGLSEDEYITLKDSILVSGETAQGLPAGFERGTVYNENYRELEGDMFLAYRDTAIVEFKTDDGQGRNFVVSVIAEKFSNQDEFAKLGRAIEEAIVSHFEKE